MAIKWIITLYTHCTLTKETVAEITDIISRNEIDTDSITVSHTKAKPHAISVTGTTDDNMETITSIAESITRFLNSNSCHVEQTFITKPVDTMSMIGEEKYGKQQA